MPADYAARAPASRPSLRAPSAPATWRLCVHSSSRSTQRRRDANGMSSCGPCLWSVPTFRCAKTCPMSMPPSSVSPQALDAPWVAIPAKVAHTNSHSRPLDDLDCGLSPADTWPPSPSGDGDCVRRAPVAAGGNESRAEVDSTRSGTAPRCGWSSTLPPSTEAAVAQSCTLLYRGFAIRTG
jgi:hypothetical protein